MSLLSLFHLILNFIEAYYFSLFSEHTAAILESNTDGVSDEDSQEEDDDLDDNGDTEDDTMNQIESINLSSLPVKRKAVLEEPTIPLCADDDCGYRLTLM